MNRRGFLKIVGAAASAVGVRGCHSGSDNTEPRQPVPLKPDSKTKLVGRLRSSPCYGTSESMLGNEEELSIYDRVSRITPAMRGQKEPTDRG